MSAADGVSDTRRRERRASDVNYLRKLGHDIEWIGDVSDLGLGADDGEIARYARETDRLILTQDDDFFTELDVERTAGVLFQQDGTLSGREVGDIVHELSEYVDQSEVVLEYVSRNWL
jgi:predicted nuclease of predicted toxin-antitoxin system